MIKVSLIKKHYQVKVGAKNIVTSCDPATVTATNSDSTVLGTATVASGGTGNIPISDSEIRRSDASLIVSVPATEPATIQDSVVNIEYANGTPISTNNVMAATNVTLLVANPLTLQQTIDGNTSANIATAINNAIDTDKPDDVFTGIIPNVDNATVEAGLSLAQRNALSRVLLYKIGVPVIYAANDIGSNNPGRGTDWFTLAENNPNGNLNRFELLGTDVVIDWAYSLYWTRFIQSPSRTSWANHLSNSAALTLEGLTGWRLPSVPEALSILDQFEGDPLDYTPFNIKSGTTAGASFFFATGQTSLANTSNFKTFFLNSASRGLLLDSDRPKTDALGSVALYCKTF